LKLSEVAFSLVAETIPTLKPRFREHKLIRDVSFVIGSPSEPIAFFESWGKAMRSVVQGDLVSQVSPTSHEGDSMRQVGVCLLFAYCIPGKVLPSPFQYHFLP
jgi:hypothetical protein